MITFIMLTKLAPDSLKSPRALEDLEQTVMTQVRGECPQVEWLANYAVLGPIDYVDIFRAPDLDTAMKVATLVRTFGHARTEVWPAKTWQDFKELVRHLPAASGLIAE